MIFWQNFHILDSVRKSGGVYKPILRKGPHMYKTNELFDVTKTIARDYVAGCEWPWQVLEDIGGCIAEIGKGLDESKFDHPAETVWIAKSATVAPSASITGPCIIDEDAAVRHCAFIRGNAIVGKGAVVGNSTELKNAILFDGAQAPHYDYVGDSVLGYKAHTGAGVVCSNVKSDKTLVVIHAADGDRETGRKKVGALIGDNVEVGCNAVLNPGTVLGRGASVYPTSCVRGVVEENCIFKNDGIVVKKW